MRDAASADMRGTSKLHHLFREIILGRALEEWARALRLATFCNAGFGRQHRHVDPCVRWGGDETQARTHDAIVDRIFVISRTSSTHAPLLKQRR